MGLVNIQMTNFENGVNNRNAADLFGSMGQLDPTKFHNYLEDFDYFVAADFTITSTGTTALADGDGGLLLLTTTAVDNQVHQLQKVGASFAFETSKPLYFRAKFQTNEALQSDILFGLYVTDVSPIASAPADGVFFRKSDGAATIDIVHASSSTETTETAIATLVVDTDTTLEFYWDGIDRVYFGVDGVPLGFVDLSSATLVSADLRPSFVFQNGEAAINTMTVDYLFVAKER